MRYAKEMKDQRFGHLKVIERSTHHNAKGQVYWVCECDCGRRLIVRGDLLRAGASTKCTACRNHGGKPSKFIYEEGEKHG